MKKIISFSLLILLFIGIYSCKKSETPAIELNAKGKKIIARSNTFGVEIFKKVYQAEDEEDNIMISPYSISMALGMLLNGAEENTADGIKEALDFSSLNTDDINSSYKLIMNYLQKADPETKMAIANSIWQRNGFPVDADFLDVNKDYFDAITYERDFSNSNTVDEINEWCADQTNDKINRVIDDISNDAVMFLINAIYFNAEWKYQFEDDNVIEEPFYVEPGSAIQVDMMYQEASFNYFQNEDVEMLQLPYGNEKFNMQIILPKDDNTLDDIVEDISSEEVNIWIDGLREQPEVVVSLPKFKFEYKERLNTILQEMGMVDAFNSSTANLSGISSAAQLFVSFVDHFTFIDVNTEGTEAAAVTVIGIEYNSVGDDNKVYFNANKPFLFALTEKETNTILFIGSVKAPEYED